MKSRLVFALLILSAASLPAQTSHLGYCMNPSGTWIPLLSQGIPTAYQAPATQLYGMNGYAQAPLRCDALGNLQTSMGNYASAPATCSTGQTYFNTGNSTPYYCSAANTWTAFLGGSAYTLPTATSIILGGVKPDGTTISNTAGAIAVASPYNPASVAITGGSISMPTGSSIDVTETVTGLYGVNNANGFFQTNLPNDGSTATVINKTVCENSSGNAQMCDANVKSHVVGACTAGCGSTGYPKVAVRGNIATLTFDATAAVVAGDWVVTSGITAVGTTGQTCNLTAFNGAGGTGATATVALTGLNAIAGGTALVVTNTGTGYTAVSTSATVGNGTATCSGPATIATSLGGSQGSAVILYGLKLTN
jgi:hypothetical protein